MGSPLQTLSSVLTCVPSSIVWIVKSISGTGFFCCIARIALSTWRMRCSSWVTGGWAGGPSVSILAGEKGDMR